MGKLVMTLLVRNEQDILETNIEYHLSQGVDFIIVTDNISDDSTPEIIRHYEALGVAKYLQESDDSYNQHIWVTRMARMAYLEYQADWVINNDADEFWWSDNGTLEAYFSRLDLNTNVVEVSRHNFVALSNLVDTFFSEMIYRESISRNALGDLLPHKVAHRGHSSIKIRQGNHSVVGFSDIKSINSDLCIFHYPLRTYNQFKKKIEKGGAAYQRNLELDASIGSTWRALYAELIENGHLLDTYNRLSYEKNEISNELLNGNLVIDKRLKEYLKNL